MDIKEIKQLIALMNENNLTEIEIVENGNTIRLKKQDLTATTKEWVWQSQPSPVAGDLQETQVKYPTGKYSTTRSQMVEEVKNTTEITSPIVGTFYRAPSPTSPPYVEIGDKVTEEKVVCIIEAMKVMNEIKAEMNGEVVDILVENGQPVEYGQPLFVIRIS